MGDNSSIAWCDATFNPWIGCEEQSPACDNCYAREFMTRKLRWANTWNGERVRTSEANWRAPIAWNSQAAASGKRRRVFCASLADVFDDQVDIGWRQDLYRLIYETPALDWLLLTKRPQNVEPMLGGCTFPDNVWLGTTVENQEEADRRIPRLLAVPAKVHFLSCEPMLGPLNLERIDLNGYSEIFPLTGTTECEDDDGNPIADIPRVDWIICGGESGPNMRRMELDWARSLRDQCFTAGVPFFMKQMNGKSQRSMEPIPDDLMIREFPHG